jgi:glucan biosynthesis protein
VFQVRPRGDDPVELRAFLQQGQDALTETWSYRVEP